MSMERDRAGQRAYFMVRNANTKLPVTGDAANLTASVVRDGTRSAATNAATEVDATNLPGVYELELTLAESKTPNLLPWINSSTASTVVEPMPAGPTLDGGVPLLGPFTATGTPTTTTVACTVSPTGTDDDYFPQGANDGAARFVIVRSGDRRGEMARIASSTIVGTTLTLEFSAMKGAMDAGDTFVVGGR